MNKYYLILFVGFICFGYCLNGCVRVIMSAYKRAKIRRDYPAVNKADDDTVCNGPHAWENSQLAMSELPIKSYKVCTDCGYVAGTQYCLNKPGREVLINNVTRRKAREARYQNAVQVKYERSQDIMRRLVQEHVFKLNSDESNNVNVLKNFFGRSVIELDELYSKLNKSLADEDNRG